MHMFLIGLLFAGTPVPPAPPAPTVSTLRNPLVFPLQATAKQQRAIADWHADIDESGLVVLRTLPLATNAAVPRTRAWSRLSALAREQPGAAVATNTLWLTRDLWGGFGHPDALRIVPDGQAVRVCGLGQSTPVCVRFTAEGAASLIDVGAMRATLHAARATVPLQTAHQDRVAALTPQTAPLLARKAAVATVVVEPDCAKRQVVVAIVVDDARAGPVPWRYDAFTGASLGPVTSQVYEINIERDDAFLDTWLRASSCPHAQP